MRKTIVVLATLITVVTVAAYWRFHPTRATHLFYSERDYFHRDYVRWYLPMALAWRADGSGRAAFYEAPSNMVAIIFLDEQPNQTGLAIPNPQRDSIEIRMKVGTVRVQRAANTFVYCDPSGALHAWPLSPGEGDRFFLSLGDGQTPSPELQEKFDAFIDSFKDRPEIAGQNTITRKPGPVIYSYESH